MKTISLNHLGLVLAAMLLSACASTPTWEGMSETEIADWKELHVGPGDAQAYREAGLETKAVSQWMDNGFKSAKAVLAWQKAGFTAAKAGAWNSKGFSLDQAVEWKQESFSPDEANEWKTAGFNLQDSIDSRKKGLTPIEPK